MLKQSILTLWASAILAGSAHAEIPKIDKRLMTIDIVEQILWENSGAIEIEQNKVDEMEIFRQHTDRELKLLWEWFFRHWDKDATIRWFIQNYQLFSDIWYQKKFLTKESRDIFENIMREVTEVYLHEVWTPADLWWNEIKILTNYHQNTDFFILLFHKDILVPWWNLGNIVIRKSGENSIIISHTGLQNEKKFTIK